MMIPTVKVKRDGPKGYHIINQSDFDTAIHELADAPDRDPLDHDADRKKGGSLPRARKAKG